MTTDHNPFAPPRAESQPLDMAVGGEAEEIRRRFMNREACTKAVGWFTVISGVVQLLSGLLLLAALPQTLEHMGPMNWLALAHGLVLGVFFLWAGSGLCRLKNAARVGAIGVFIAFFILGLVTRYFHVLPVQAVYLACLIGPGAKYVCSTEYRDVVKQTRPLNRRAALRVFLWAIAVFFIIGAVMILQAAFAPSADSGQ